MQRLRARIPPDNWRWRLYELHRLAAGAAKADIAFVLSEDLDFRLEGDDADDYRFERIGPPFDTWCRGCHARVGVVAPELPTG